MRRKILKVGATTLALGLVATGCGNSDGDSADASETITLTVMDSRSPEHYIVKDAVEPWMERIEELTDGEITFDFYPAEQLGAMNDSLSYLQSGTADIAYVPPAVYAGEMPLSEFHTLPGIFDDAERSGRVMMDLSNEGLIAETDYAENGIKHLWGAMTLPGEVLTVNQPIDGVDDMKGLRIRGSGGAIEATLSSMGADTITLPTPEVYQAMETGTVDGTMMATASAVSYSVHEVTNYITQGAVLGSYWMGMSISDSTWASLSTEHQEAILTASEEAFIAGTQSAEEATAAAMDEFVAAGAEVREITPEAQQEFRGHYEDIEQDWAEQHGEDAAAVLSEARQILEDLQ